MSLLNRYFLRAHIGPFIFGFSLVMFIFLMQFMIKLLGKLAGKGLDTSVILQFILLNLAPMVVFAVPMGVLFSTLMAFGSMSAAHEVTIVKASGGSLLRMMRPFILAGAILMVGMFYFNDIVLPETNYQARMLMSDMSRKKPAFAVEAGQFSTAIDGYTILSRRVDSISGALYGVTIYDKTRSTQTNIVSADTGYLSFTPDYSKLILQLKHGEVHQSNSNNIHNYKIINFSDYKIAMVAEGFDFQRSSEGMLSRNDRNMNISEMRSIAGEANRNMTNTDNSVENTLNSHLKYVVGSSNYSNSTNLNNAEASNRLSGYMRVAHRLNLLATKLRTEISIYNDQKTRASQFEVEIYKKYAIPFACLLFVFVGCPLGIITKGGNFGLSAAMSLGFYIFYWVSLIGGEKLADRGIMSPALSMWLGNILLLLLGIILTLKVNYETLDFLNIRRLFGKKR